MAALDKLGIPYQIMKPSVVKQDFILIHDTELAKAAADLLNKIDNMTTDEFSKGGEKAEREALRRILEERYPNS